MLAQKGSGTLTDCQISIIASTMGVDGVNV